MAEEKKLADEVLSDEELEQVAGGSIEGTSRDSHLLYDYGLIDDWYSHTGVVFHWESYSANVDSGWAKAGITCVTKPTGYDNQYFAGGTEISRDEAVKILKSKFGRIHYTYSDDDRLG